MSDAHTPLGSFLQSWRGRVAPAAVGLPVNGPRRTPGLRREELAALAGVSVDYLVRLEQGRAANPSVDVLASLARALQLSVEERVRVVLYTAEPATPDSDKLGLVTVIGLQDVPADPSRPRS